MLAGFASTVNPENPLQALQVAERPEPDVAEGWVPVTVKAAALNHHDLWSLSGVGLSAEQCPMILGCDAAGVDPDGNEVIVHAVLGDPQAGGGDETLDPKRSLLSEKYQGTLAETVAVPRGNLIPKPESWSFAAAACLPTAYLTAYRMLVTKGRLPSDGAVLVHGAGGGVSTAAILLARAMGARVYVTGRTPSRRARAPELGANPVETGARLPERVDVVIDSVGEPTIGHSLKSLKPGGRVVTCGTTGGHLAEVDLRRVFFLQLELLGSTMGTREELLALSRLCVDNEVTPLIDSTFPLSDAAEAFARLHSGEAFGKIVVQP